MKRNFVLLALVAIALCAGCDDKSESESTGYTGAVYNLGDVGPAGGKVFYDVDADNDSGNTDGLTSSECGWRYFEAATSDLSTATTYWSTASSTLGTGTAIGTGKDNTRKMAAQGSNHPAGYAVWGKDIGGYTDWFIPSKDELNAMYVNRSYIGDTFQTGASAYYWSSTEASSISAYCQKFVDGSVASFIRDSTNVTFYVRPIRRF